MQSSVIIQGACNHIAAVSTHAHQSIFKVLNCVHSTNQLLVKSVDSLLKGESLRCTSTCDTHFVEPELKVINLVFGQLQAIL